MWLVRNISTNQIGKFNQFLGSFNQSVLESIILGLHDHRARLVKIIMHGHSSGRNEEGQETNF